MRAPQVVSDESGFTLVELMVVMTILLVLIGVAMMLVQVLNKIADVQSAQAYFAKNATLPIESFDKSLAQNIRVDSSSDTSTVAYTIVRSSNSVDTEKHVVTAGPDGHLTESIYRPADALSPTEVILWSDQNANVQLGEPLFRYQTVDASGSVVSTAPAVATQAFIDVWTIYDKQSSDATRTVFFRNDRAP